jgi:2-C-methyl-D-erythritol 4-phosphate cytidylyltransferase
MKKYAVIVAGGSGQRMGSAVPKQFLLLKGKPLLQYTLQSFLTAYPDMQIVLVLPMEHVAQGHEIVKHLDASEKVQITTGGETRFHSVKNGLNHIMHPSIVFVHDGVRCMVTPKLITTCYKQAVKLGSAIPAVSATDSIRITEGAGHYTINRNSVQIIQTPQTFRSDILCEAFKQEYIPSFTDEATVAEAAGYPVFLIEGEYDNLKITRPIDVLIAEKLLEQKCKHEETL